MMRNLVHLLLSLTLALGCAGAWANDLPPLDASLRESVDMIPKHAGIELETTFFRPEGDGPFPVVIINHGKQLGDVRNQPRYRPLYAARYFLDRGYAVVVPMRQGFSQSTGRYASAGCDLERNGLLQAQDVKAVLDHLRGQAWADTSRMLVVGQSHGGWTTLAFGAHNYPGVRGLVNFAGGLRQGNCPMWREQMATASAQFARRTRVPSLWFYGENDSFFDPAIVTPMFENYQSAGGRARLVAFGKFGSDAHRLFSSQAGTTIWQPELTTFLAEIGMPHEPVGRSASPEAARLKSPAAARRVPGIRIED